MIASSPRARFHPRAASGDPHPRARQACTTLPSPQQDPPAGAAPLRFAFIYTPNGYNQATFAPKMIEPWEKEVEKIVTCIQTVEKIVEVRCETIKVEEIEKNKVEVVIQEKYKEIEKAVPYVI